MQPARMLLLVVTAGLLLAGCGEDSPPPAAQSPVAEERPAPVVPARALEVRKRPSLAEQRKKREKDAAALTSRRGKYSSGAVALSDTPSMKLTAGDAALDAELQALLPTLGPSTPKDACLNAISRLSGLPSTLMPQAVQRLLSHADPEVRGMALTALEGYDDPALLPVVDLALKDKDADVRLQALEVLGPVTAPAVKQTVSRALDDADPNVRAAAFQLGLSQPPAARKELVMQAAASPQPELAMTAIQVLDGEPDKTSVPVILNALSHPSPEVREAARDALTLTFHADFSDPNAARRWWTANQHRYDAALVELQPAR